MNKTGRLNRNGIAILKSSTPTPKPRSISQNIAVAQNLVNKAQRHDVVVSGGVNAK